MLERVKQLLRAFVILGISGCLIGSATLAGQSRDDLRRKCGEPISETFIVRPGVTVTATYAKDGHITELLIAPQNTDLIKSRGKALDYDAAHAIVDELVPVSVRGTYLVAALVNAACLPANDCHGTSHTYDKVTIYYNAGEGEQVHYAVVQWKQ